MVLGKKKEVKKVIKLTPKQKDAKLNFIKNKINKMKNSIKIPPAINQFKTTLEKSDEEKVINLFMKYKPENKKEKKERLKNITTNKSDNTDKSDNTNKPIITKFGLKHITDLIMNKKVTLVLIASDVIPIVNVCYLPTLCKMYGVSYGIVEKQSTLGMVVNMKKTTCIGLERVKEEDSKLLTTAKEVVDGVFMNRYETHMTVVGGSNVKKVNKLEG